MACEQSEKMNELAFFAGIRERPLGECVGPLATLSLWSWQVGQLERIFQDGPHSDLLWSGFVTDRYIGIHYELCAGHWFDLVWFAGLMAYRHGRRDWAVQSGSLLRDLCYVCGWDQKEVANLITGMGARLT
jgi:hypothetical protein